MKPLLGPILLDPTNMDIHQHEATFRFCPSLCLEICVVYIEYHNCVVYLDLYHVLARKKSKNQIDMIVYQ